MAVQPPRSGPTTRVHSSWKTAHTVRCKGCKAMTRRMVTRPYIVARTATRYPRVRLGIRGREQGSGSGWTADPPRLMTSVRLPRSRRQYRGGGGIATGRRNVYTPMMSPVIRAVSVRMVD